MRDAAKTKAQILVSARAILARDGFAGLGVNALAGEAGVGKPLIYRYFGNMEGVAAALASDGAAGSTDEHTALACDSAAEAVASLVQYGRGLAGDRTRRDLLAWSLAAPHAPPLETAGKEAPGTIAGAHPDRDPAGVMAIMQAAIAFLLIHSDRHDAWAGLPLDEPRHLARLERAMAAIVQATLSGTEVTGK